MRNIFVAALFAACIAAPACAEDQPAPAPAATVEAPAAAAVSVSVGQTIYGPDGRRLGQVERLSSNGSPSLIMGNYFLEVPLNSLSLADGRLVTSRTLRQLQGH